jgi:site-specific DNA-methyltransferase (adenine-specific)
MSVNIATSNGFLLNDDCMELLQNMRSGMVDCVFADPPFNLDKNYGPGVHDNLPEKDYLSWTKSWLRECIRVLKPGGSLLVYNVPRWQIQIGAWLMSNAKLSFRHWISVSMKNSPPRGTRLYPAHYGLLYFTKGEPKTFNKDLVRVPLPTCRKCHEPLPDWGGYKDRLHPGGVNLSDIWTDTSPVRHRRYKARQKGVNELDPKIPERAILLTTQPGDIVLDPFGGGGTTYRMAERHGRRWLGAEIGDSSIIREGLVAQGVEPVLQPVHDLVRLFKTWPNIWNEGIETRSALNASQDGLDVQHQ